MKISLTTPAGVNFSILNEFSNYPIMEANLEEKVSTKEREAILNRYAIYRKWRFKQISGNRSIFESVDISGNTLYVIIED